jgi:prepilin-type N-terminal cleavage/methylation domain-containing protein
MRSTPRARRRAFTLLELMIAVTILAAITTVTYMTFSAVSEAWKRGMRLTDNIHHGDFVAEQLVMGLRSAYYAKPRGSADSLYGFWHEDNGDGPRDADRISWVKVGAALVGRDCPYAGSPHRVTVTIEEDADNRPAVAVTSWRVKGQPEDFDPEMLDPVFLSTRVRGFNCRTAYETDEGGEIDWLDEWEETNKVPRLVEITLFLDPLDEGERPVEIRRLMSLPAGELSWSK